MTDDSAETMKHDVPMSNSQMELTKWNLCLELMQTINILNSQLEIIEWASCLEFISVPHTVALCLLLSVFQQRRDITDALYIVIQLNLM